MSHLSLWLLAVFINFCPFKKLTCLVKLQVFKIRHNGLFWHFWWILVHSNCKHSSLRSQHCCFDDDQYNRCRYMQLHDTLFIYGQEDTLSSQTHSLVTGVTVQFFFLLNSANTQQSNCLSLPPKKRKNFELNSIVSLLACCFQHLLNNNPVKVFKIRSELIFKSKFLRRGEQKVISFCLQGVQVSLGAIFHT